MGTLFWKCFFAFWLSLLAAGTGVGTAVWLRHEALQNREEQVLDLHRHTAPFVGAAATTLRHGGVQALRELLREQRGEPAPPVYVVDRNDKDILGRAMAPETVVQARLVAAEGAHPLEVRRVTADDGQEYLLFVPSPDSGIAERLPLLRGEEPPPSHRGEPLRRPPRMWVRSPVVPIASGIFASLIFSAWLAWYLAKPIRTLRAAFDGLAKGRLDTRVSHLMGKRRDELSDLGKDFDHMAVQIGTLVDAQRRLLHDVSHELRSPLSRLQAAIGLARQQPDKMQATLARVEREAERLNDLVGELLALSRLEAGVPVAKEEVFDLGELLAEIVEDARFEAEAKGVRVSLASPGEIMFHGQVELIHRAIENVVRNAVQHTPAGAAVAVEIALRSGRLHLVVRDGGQGVPEPELAKIFTPFFRGDSRQTGDGVGLGLAIARLAVESHDGSIAARNQEKGGLEVTIRLPLRSGR